MTTDLEKRRAIEQHWAASEAGDVELEHRLYAEDAILDYLPDASVSLDHQASDAMAARFEMIADHYEARRSVPRDGEVPYRPLPPDRLYIDRAGWDAMLAPHKLVTLSPFARPDSAEGVDGGGRPSPVFAQAAATVLTRLLAPGPNNPVGSFWIGLSAEGYGIHGTPNPSKISKSESHGCVRML